MKGEYYVTSFCNFTHRMRDGRPVGPPEGPNGKRTRHDCPQLSPTKLRLERDFGANAVSGCMTEFLPGEAEALAENDEDALDSLYWQRAPIPKCWLCEGRGYIEAPDEFSSVHTEQLNCPVCDRNPLRAGALLPALPLTGYAYLVQWFAHETGNNILIARTLAQMRKMVISVAERHPWAVYLGGDFVEIVSPPTEYQQLYAEKQRERTEYFFWRWVESHLQVLREQGKEMPKPLGLCKTYRKQRAAKSWTDDFDHARCVNCTYGVTLNGVDPKAWYAERQNPYYAALARKTISGGPTMWGPLRSEARAQPALNLNRLYYIHPFGGQGVPLTRFRPAPKSGPEQKEILRDSNTPVLWFERLGDYPDNEASKKIFAEARAEAEAEVSAKTEARTREKEAEFAREARAFLSLVSVGQEAE